ncbi:MAG: ABC transporter ATP-binding protein [Anaerolineales bacterium]|nr:ABC transporter ATP-binding protein [Anaerolineales bacterium]
MQNPLLIVEGLYKYFPIPRSLSQTVTFQPHKVVHAVDNVSFEVKRGEIFALVGESGSGKTTVGMNVLGLQTPTKGRIRFDGYEVSDWSRGELKNNANAKNGISALSKREQIMLLRRRVQMIFQDPYESLNPRIKIFDIVAEPLRIHGLSKNQDEIDRVRTALETSGLVPADHFWDRYPDGLSGGQRQRVAIAGALVLEPELLVADEPVSMLDVSIRAEVLKLLKNLCEKNNITIIYTTHDLATAGVFTDRMAVMYLGRIVELGTTAEILLNPRHPYTRALISVVPVPNPRMRKEKNVLEGEVPNPIDLPTGCRFHPRCPQASEQCKIQDPELGQVSDNHYVACLKG